MSISWFVSQEEADAALAAAVTANNVAETKRWLEKGADPDARASVNDDSPLCKAIAIHKNPELVGMLAARSKKLNDTDSCDFTPFTHAVRRNQPEIAAILLDNGANPFPPGKGSEYPIDWAVANNLYPLIGRMLALSGKPDRPFKDEGPLLLLAARGNDMELAKACLDAGANINCGKKDDGFTALHLAARNGDAGFITFLLERGAATEKQDASNQTPLDWARGAGKDAVFCRILTERHMQETAREMMEGTPQRIVIRQPLRLKQQQAGNVAP